MYKIGLAFEAMCAQPGSMFTEGERVTWSPSVYINRHAELQVRTDLTKVLKAPGTPAQLDAARRE